MSAETETADPPEDATRRLRSPRKSRPPAAGQDVLYHDHCPHAGRVVAFPAKITHVDRPDDPETTVVLTVFTPHHPAGAARRELVPRGAAAGCWEDRP